MSRQAIDPKAWYLSDTFTYMRVVNVVSTQPHPNLLLLPAYEQVEEETF